MALKTDNLEGKEIALDYKRDSLPQGRWSDAWAVFKASALKLILINLLILVTVAPMVAIVLVRNSYILTLGSVYPLNPSVSYPFYPDTRGLAEQIILSADAAFYAMLIAAGFIASVGLAGATYSIRKLLNTHGKFTFKGFFRGIKACYFNAALPVTVALTFIYASLMTWDWMKLVIAQGGNAAGAITAVVFVIIATVLVCVYCAWLFAVGTSYKIKFTQVFKNAFVMMLGTPLQTVIMAGISLVPVWLMLIGGFFGTIGLIAFIIIGFSLILFIWNAFTQWAFDGFVTPTIEQESVQATKEKKAAETDDDPERRARELLAAGRSELIARPIKPLGDAGVAELGKTFTRGDVAAVAAGREKLVAEIAAYEKEHENDPAFVEYNKLFAEREKALQPVTDKKGKKKKVISSENLLK